MATQIIEFDPDLQRDYPENDNYLEISEFFCDTIQGEGIHIGHPAAFLRLQNCTLNCEWCDTEWRYGAPWTFTELLDMMEESGLVIALREGQHFVLTGGSPLMQQDKIFPFMRTFAARFGFIPFIEIENECTIKPTDDMVQLVNTWNNSPKLNNSRNGKFIRYQPDILEYMSGLDDSWFKFVITSGEDDWAEIYQDFIGLIDREQIILMPRGETIEELQKNREFVVNMAIKHNVKYCSREHVVLWDTATGV
jgi:organic radical activating enzyme